MKRIFSLLLLLSFALAPATAAAGSDGMIVLLPGQEREVRFYLKDGAPAQDLHTVPVLMLGGAGTLTAELSVDPEGELDLEFTDEIRGALGGVSFSLAHPFSFSFGQELELPVNAEFGFALIVAAITFIETEETLKDDIPCSIALSISRTPEPEAGTGD